MLGSSLRILFFGDIFGRPGREALKSLLPELQKTFRPDFVIGNVENIAHGKGITPDTIQEVLDAGVHFLTSGNHVWSGRDVARLLSDPAIPIVRPANYPSGLPGDGCRVAKIGDTQVGVINLLGRVFMHQNVDDPFRKADEILASLPADVKIILVDWHAEATSEKVALGWYLDGRVSAVLGTHTHVPTSDLKILPKGTAYVTDVGMVGPRDSVIGKNPEASIKHFLTSLPTPLDIAEGPAQVNAVLIDIDSKTGRAVSVERIQRVVERF